MHIYAFGSVCRGEVDFGSDVDLIAIIDGYDKRFDPQKYSIYTYKRIRNIFNLGNPFAWHLYLESVLLFSSNDEDFLKTNKPSKYIKVKQDCLKFYNIFKKAKQSFYKSNESKVFDLSTVFLTIRNFATCYSFRKKAPPCFSRYSCLSLGSYSLDIVPEDFNLFLKARILCTRGVGKMLNCTEIDIASKNLNLIEDWMNKCLDNIGGSNV